MIPGRRRAVAIVCGRLHLRRQALAPAVIAIVGQRRRGPILVLYLVRCLLGRGVGYGDGRRYRIWRS